VKSDAQNMRVVSQLMEDEEEYVSENTIIVKRIGGVQIQCIQFATVVAAN